MHAEKAIHALLMQASVVTSLVGARCYPGQLPQGCPLPALVVEHISTVQASTLDANAEFNLARTRVQVTALASDYPTQKALVHAVAGACTFQRGLIAGVTVISVMRDLIGPDLRDDDRSVFFQAVDFVVTFQDLTPT